MHYNLYHIYFNTGMTVRHINKRHEQHKYLSRSGGGHFLCVLGAAVEPLDVNPDVDHHLQAERAHGVVLQVQRVLVPLHVPLARKDFVADIAGKVPALPLVDLGDVNA